MYYSPEQIKKMSLTEVSAALKEKTIETKRLKEQLEKLKKNLYRRKS